MNTPSTTETGQIADKAEQSTEKTGKLTVDVASDSVYFGLNVPLEIRDSNMRLVQRTDHERRFDLPAGMYQISAVLEDGQEHRRLAKVSVGGDTKVAITASGKQSAYSKSMKTQATEAPFIQAPSYVQKVEAIDEAEIDSLAPDLATELLDVQGASLTRATRTLWIFDSDDDIDAVPVAKVRVGDVVTDISLPTSPGGGPTLNTCAVRIDESPTRAYASAWISPERTVANALQNMLASGELRYAARMANEATELLRDKYSDPAGAVLGALILNKVGGLSRLESWVDNLASDFGWLPDGKILLASLLVKRRADQDRALQLASQASEQRMLYTDSYSILLDLLRRWPGKDNRELRNQAMANLAPYSSFIDWDSICLSNTQKG